MRILGDENLIPSHVSTLDSAGHDVVRSAHLLEKGASDETVLTTATAENRVLITYDRKDFSDVTDHAGVLIATETMRARNLRTAVGRVEQAYPTLADTIEFLSDWV